MSYTIEYKTITIAELESLTSAVRERIVRKISWLGDNFENVTPQPLTADLSDLFKLRVGDYRVIYSFSSESQILTIHKIGHRREIYE